MQKTGPGVNEPFRPCPAKEDCTRISIVALVWLRKMNKGTMTYMVALIPP